MTGRARGRSRGRGRGGGGGDAARRPGEGTQHSIPEQVAPVGRGRSRGPPPAQAAAVAPQPQQKPVAPPTEAMAAMSVRQEQRPPVGTTGSAEQRPPRRQIQSEPATKPAHVVDKKGGTGKSIPLVSNHFRLMTKPNFGVYQYNVSFNPELESKRLRVALLKSQSEVIGQVHAFDGMMLFLPKRLPDPVTKFNLETRSGNAVEMTITLTNEIPKDSPSMLQLYNIIFRRILKNIGMQQVGRNYYHIKHPIEIDKFKLELWPGYATSILPYETEVLLSADVSHKVLRTTTVLDFLYELYGSCKQDFHNTATKKLVGQIILTRYNNKTYRIDDIKWDVFPSHTFHGRFKGVERDISYRDYYLETYDKKITDMDQPLLVSRLKKIPGQKMRIPEGELYLVPELCFLTGLTDEMRNDFMLMKDLAVHTRVDPQARNQSLLRFMGSIQSNQESSAELSGWGLEFEKTTLNLGGRVLPPEKIYQSTKSYFYDPKSADWSREMRGNPLHSTVNLKREKWLLIYSKKDTSSAKDFALTLKKVCGPMGINVEQPMEIPLSDDRTDSYLNVIKKNYDEDLQMVVTILPTNRKDRYDAIKKLCCLEKPVPSQVIVGRTISKKQMLMSVCTKIGIQINVKLGGEAWAVEIPLQKTMVIGIDCYHDSLTKGRSVGGFVASMNKTLTKYHSSVTFQHTGMELIDELKTCMTAALRKYSEINGDLPERIIIYRDGVGDGQLRLVVEHEVPQLKASFQEIAGGYKPKFSVVIVKKRISARIFSRSGGAPSLTNPPPGTVVDTDITRKEWYDFFLVSQSVRQGTVSPTHYNVIEDSSGLTPDHFQRLTYKLTHLYYNWPGTVRVPAPCQYAHKLAFLVGQSLHHKPNKETLADKLYFL